MKKTQLLVVLFALICLAGLVYYGVFTKDSKGQIPLDDFRKLDTGKQTEIIKSMAADSPAEAWTYLKDAFIINGEVVGNAHGMAHAVGNQAYENLGIEGIKICDGAFAFGCFHGVTEMMLLDKGASGAQLIQSECAKIFSPNDGTVDFASCIHGTGHGLYSFESGNKQKALLDCDVMNEANRQYCYDGVFMEYSFSAESHVYSAKDPWKACSSLAEQYQRNCARYQSQIFLNSPSDESPNEGGRDSVKQAGKYCAMGPSQILRETCFESLGYYVAENDLGSPDKIWTDCQKMPNEEGRTICTIGGATETVFQKYGDFVKSSELLCKKLLGTRQEECFSHFKNLISVGSFNS